MSPSRMCLSLAAAFLAALPTATPAQAEARRTLRIHEELTVTYAQGWALSESPYANAQELVLREPVAGKPGEFVQSRVLITREERTSAEDAVHRLGEIAAEVPGAEVSFLKVGGWPALQRRYQVPLAHRGQDATLPAQMSPRVTTAVAVRATVVRIEAEMAPSAGKRALQASEAVGRSLRGVAPTAAESPKVDRALRDLQVQHRKLQRQAKPPKKASAEEALPVEEAMPTPVRTGIGVLVPGTSGEVEVAASASGQDIVVATNGGWAFSNNGGTTFTAGGGTPAAFPRDGDPSLAVGASGTFFYAFIGFPDGTPAANNQTGCSTGVSVSTNNGQAFAFRNHATLCGNGATACVPDQEHIAADRTNAAPGGGDQVYSVWRNFVPANPTPTTTCRGIGSGFVTPSIVCSTDGGQNWTARFALNAGDFPRVSVGQDGFVYVVYRQNANVMLDKFSSCANGLARQAGWPVTAASVTDVTCPVPGLDRCNDGNSLSSHMVAVDDTVANRIYVAFATNTAAGNEDVVLRASFDGGRTFPQQTTLNAAVTARRFMPWVCAQAGAAFVSWYDRRKASRLVLLRPACLRDCDDLFADCDDADFGRPGVCRRLLAACKRRCYTRSSNDLTEYYYAFARVRAGTLQSEGETNLSGTPDPQCASGWPCGARSANDYGSCSVQPQNGNPGGGCPKYGDYNGNACAAGRAFFAWASATSPVGAPSGTGIRVFFDASPQPATLTVTKQLSPSSDPGRFNLLVDGTVRALNVGDNGTTGPITVLPGNHVVSESGAAGTTLLKYDSTVGGDCAPNGAVSFASGASKSCVITNTRISRQQCLDECAGLRDDCMSQVGEPGGPLASWCAQLYVRCRNRC